VSRVIAVDLGSRRVGLARSDETGTIAEPLGVLAAEPAESLVARLAAAAAEAGAAEIVIGLPRRLDGSLGPEAKAARDLAEQLRQVSRLPVSLVDERLSTVQAERALIASGARRAKRKQVRDEVAATLILQSFLAGRRG
jgi:putative Holliday junction resolvase